MDRLGGLPEEVICHVLSFLPTNTLVQTSILAKQWRFLWTRVSVLGFNVVEDSNTTDDITIFACNLLNVVIRLDNFDQLVLPRRNRLFTSDTLVDLCIVDSGRFIIQGDAYNFPALKKLRLVNVGYDSDEYFAQLIAGCPSLEELIMDNMNICDSDPSLQTLEELQLSYLSIRGSQIPYFLMMNICDSDLSLPRLEELQLRYLRIRGSHIPQFWMSSKHKHRLHSLIEADIDLSEDKMLEVVGGSYLPLIVTFFLPNLSNVKRLTLSTRCIVDPVICLQPDKPLDFPNLTELILRADWCFVPIFFAHAKNLRVITIHHSTVDHHMQCWRESFSFITSTLHIYCTSVCPMDHLETVNLVDFEWSADQEFEMVKYILRNAKVLKTMELIHTAPHCEESDWNHKVEALNRLASFDTPSSTCSIRFRFSS